MARFRSHHRSAKAPSVSPLLGRVFAGGKPNDVACLTDVRKGCASARESKVRDRTIAATVTPAALVIR